MKKETLTRKMCEMEIKDFSDAELHRVFNDCVAQNNLFTAARNMIDARELSMKDVYFQPCLGNDESMLDESLTGHKYHCPICNTHLTSLYLCGDCGVRYDWVVAFDEAVEQMRAADFACTCRESSEFEIKTNPACCVHGEAAQSR